MPITIQERSEFLRDSEDIRTIIENGFFEGKQGFMGINEKFWLDRIAATGTLMFCKLQQSFYLFEDGLWSIRTKAEIREFVDRFIRASIPASVESLTEQLDRMLILKNLNAAVERLCGHPMIVKDDPFSKAPLGVLLFENGRVLVDYETADIVFQENHRGCPSDLKTYRIPIDYDPSAVATKTQEWLAEMFSHEGDQEAIKKMLGVCLWGSNEWKKMIYCYGEADIGKTQLAHLVSGLIGQSKSVSFTAKQLSNRFEMRRLVGKVFVLASDVEANFMCLEGTSDVFKQMVGRDPIRVETKFKAEEHYMQGDKMVFACSNFTAKVRAIGDASAWRSRLIVLRADGKAYKDGEADTRFVHKLFANKKEASGIVNLALKGLLDILQDRHWARSKEQMERLESILSENDSVARWARECIKVAASGDETYGLLISEAWGSYLKWSERNGLEPWSERIFLEMAGDAVYSIFGKTKSHNLHRGATAHRGWRGLVLSC